MISLKDLLRDTTDKMYRLNDVLDKRLLSERDIKDEENNYLRFLYAQEKLYELLPHLDMCSWNDEDRFRQYTLELYLQIDSLRYYFSNMHKNIEKIIQAGAAEKLLDEEQLRGIVVNKPSKNRKKVKDEQ